MREFMREELALFDGMEDSPARVVCEGTVYGAPESFIRQRERHCARRVAGEALIGALVQTPHGVDILDLLPVIGELLGGE